MQEEVLTSHAILKGMLAIHKIEGARANEIMKGFQSGTKLDLFVYVSEGSFSSRENTFRF